MAEIDQELFELLDGNDLGKKQHEAMMLVTMTEEGWPHPAMLSVGEILAVNRTNLRLSLWPATTSVQNIRRTGQATLVAVYKGKAHYVRLSLQELPPLSFSKHPRERFAATVNWVKTDIAKYASLTSGIQIALHDPDSVIHRWQETLSELRE
ncbi:pyridoxamine 5'-phosphate oxidase family protein [Brevibacillus fulvus]|uniref:Pyridoxamine 5'-phosphate oxidase putative domain-containing protein n=1 Tax=Brevibacillus fulvus TaxID=1125967 RepID=A0A938Y1G2_9BACL|nr:pyridoxamine 5'-phosphate oxidase family protein [Brevibacillus fulvus]MBM7590669.1 hypothetical protein [Brevibacillus fulvus]